MPAKEQNNRGADKGANRQPAAHGKAAGRGLAHGRRRGHGGDEFDEVQSKQDLLQQLTRQAEVNTRILERERALLLALEIQNMERAHTESGDIADVPPFFAAPTGPAPGIAGHLPYPYTQGPSRHAASQPGAMQHPHELRLPAVAVRPQHAQHMPQPGQPGQGLGSTSHVGRSHVAFSEPTKVFDASQVPGLSSEAPQPHSPFRAVDGSPHHAPSPGPNRTFPDSPSFYPGMVFGVPMRAEAADGEGRPHSPTQHAAATPPPAAAVLAAGPLQRRPRQPSNLGNKPRQAAAAPHVQQQQQRRRQAVQPDAAAAGGAVARGNLRKQAGNRAVGPARPAVAAAAGRAVNPVRGSTPPTPPEPAYDVPDAPVETPYEVHQLQQPQHLMQQVQPKVGGGMPPPEAAGVWMGAMPAGAVTAASPHGHSLHGPVHVSERAAAAARKEAYRMELEAQIRAKKDRQAAEKAGSMQAEMAAQARAAAAPPPWDPAAPRRGGGGEPLRDGFGAPVADLRYGAGRPASGSTVAAHPTFAQQPSQGWPSGSLAPHHSLTIQLPSDPGQQEGTGSPGALQQQGQQGPPWPLQQQGPPWPPQQGGPADMAPGMPPRGYTGPSFPAAPPAGATAQGWFTGRAHGGHQGLPHDFAMSGPQGQPGYEGGHHYPGGGGPPPQQGMVSPGSQGSPGGGGRRFMAAMSQLVAGPSEEQMRHKEAQRAALLRDLDEQVRQKKERETWRKAQEAAAREKEESELAQHYQRMQAAKQEEQRAAQQEQQEQLYQQQQQRMQQQQQDEATGRHCKGGAARKLLDADWLGPAPSQGAVPPGVVGDRGVFGGGAGAGVEGTGAVSPSAANHHLAHHFVRRSQQDTVGSLLLQQEASQPQVKGARGSMPGAAHAHGTRNSTHGGEPAAPESVAGMLHQLQAEQARLREELVVMSSLHQAQQQVTTDRQRAWHDIERVRGMLGGQGLPHGHVPAAPGRPLHTLAEEEVEEGYPAQHLRGRGSTLDGHRSGTLPAAPFVVSTHLLPREANSIPTRLCTPLEAVWAAAREPLLQHQQQQQGVWQSEQSGLYRDTAELDDALQQADQCAHQNHTRVPGLSQHDYSTQQGLYRPVSRVQGAPPSQIPRAPIRSAWPPLGQANSHSQAPASRYRSFYNLESGGDQRSVAAAGTRLPPLQQPPAAIKQPSVAFGRRAASKPPPSPAILRGDLLLPSPDRKAHTRSAAPHSSRVRAHTSATSGGPGSARAAHQAASRKVLPALVKPPTATHATQQLQEAAAPSAPED